MPILDADPYADATRPNVTPITQPAPQRAGPVGDTVQALFHESGPIGAFVGGIEQAQTPSPVPGYSPVDYLKTRAGGQFYLDNYGDHLIGDQSPNETEQRLGRIDRELGEKRLVESVGTPGAVVSMGMGLLDPTLWLLPAGETARAVSGAVSVGRSALRVAGAGAVQGVVSEALTRGSTETRTNAESVTAIAASTVLGGLLGAGASSLLSGAERRVAARSLERDRAVLAGHPVPDREPLVPEDASPGLEAPSLEAKASSGPVDAAGSPSVGVRAADDITPAANSNNSLAAAAGAAASDARESRLASYGLDKVPILGSMVQRVDPVMRVMSGEFTSARRTLSDLAELALSTVDNAVVRDRETGAVLRDAMPTASGGVGPAETEIKLARQQSLVAMQEVFDDAWKRMRYGSADNAPILARERASFDAMMGRPETGLTFDGFKEQVSRAMRNGDQHEIPQVAEAAQWVRQNVFEPWKQRAQKAGLLPEDMPDPKTSESYLTRLYNREAMRSKPEEFIRTAADWLESEQARKRDLQTKLDYHDAIRRSIAGEGAKLRARLERLDARDKELEARVAERGMEAARTGSRAGEIEDRLGNQEGELSELAEAVSALKEQAQDPERRASIQALQDQVSDLQKRERASRMTPAALDRQDEQELRDRFLADDHQRAFADMVVGRKNPPKPPSFVDYIAKGGGIHDPGGDVAHIVGGDKKLGRKLTGDLGSPSLDSWGERLADAFPAEFPVRPEPNEILGWLDEASRGREPDWFTRGSMTDSEHRLHELGQVAADTRREMERLGYDGDKRLDVARFLRDHADADPAGPRPFSDVPESIQLEAGVGALDRQTSQVDEIRDAIAKARARTDAVEGSAARNRVRLGEAGRSADVNAARMDTLAARQEIAARKRQLIEDAIKTSDEMHARVMGDMETGVREWGGKSASEAVSALKSRDKAEAERAALAAARGGPAPTGRLGSADDAVQGAVRKILGSDRDRSRMELESRAREIFDRIVSSPDGRLPYDEAPSGGGGGMSPARAAPRGALGRRQFMIPDEMIEPFLENDIERIVGSFTRQTVPDIVLTERFGDHLMTEQIRKIQEEAHSKLAGASEDQARKILKERDEHIRDVAAIRDRIRGTFVLQGASKMENAMRIGRMVRAYNGLTDLGGAVISSVPDIAGAVFRYGFTRVLGDAYVPWVKSLVRAGDGYKLAKEQYKAMGIATEMALATRSVALDELSAMYRPQSRLERGLNVAGERMQVANLQAPWTDFTKTIASITAGNEILRAAKAVAEGTVTDKQLRDLASSNIEANMARKIWSQFEKAGGVVDGVHLPNTGQWSDKNAKLAFEGAIMRESNITVVTPGQEKPLWLSDPILGIIGQHKSFTFASTQRVMMANLQRRDAATLSGLITAVSAGMLSYSLYQLVKGQAIDASPSNMMKEGISRSSVLGWIDEANSLMAKMSRGGADMYRLVGADKPLSKFAANSIMDQLAGPTAGKITEIAKLAGSVLHGTGDRPEDRWDAHTTASVRRLLPMQNLIYLRGLLNQVEDTTNQAFGIKPLDRTPH